MAVMAPDTIYHAESFKTAECTGCRISQPFGLDYYAFSELYTSAQTHIYSGANVDMLSCIRIYIYTCVRNGNSRMLAKEREWSTCKNIQRAGPVGITLSKFGRARVCNGLASAIPLRKLSFSLPFSLSLVSTLSLSPFPHYWDKLRSRV